MIIRTGDYVKLESGVYVTVGRIVDPEHFIVEGTNEILHLSEIDDSPYIFSNDAEQIMGILNDKISTLQKWKKRYKNRSIKLSIKLDKLKISTDQEKKALQSQLDIANKKLDNLNKKIEDYSCIYNKGFPYTLLLAVGGNHPNENQYLELDKVLKDFKSIIGGE